MKYNAEYKDFDPAPETVKLIEESARRIEKKAARFPPDLLFMRIMIEANPVRTLYKLSITLPLPEKTLATREERHDVNEAIRDAFAEIERQLDGHKAALTHERLWKRQARRAKLREAKAAARKIEEPK
jgi:ribosome-associated translation inhibitor RaiA